MLVSCPLEAVSLGPTAVLITSLISSISLQIDHNTVGDTKEVTVSGPSPETVQAAVKEIESLMRTDATPGSGEVSESVPCPAGIVGRIIGRGGETIRGLQQASQAHIVVNQVTLLLPPNPRPRTSTNPCCTPIPIFSTHSLHRVEA